MQGSLQVQISSLSFCFFPGFNLVLIIVQNGFFNCLMEWVGTTSLKPWKDE